jgi:hypothetical protein
MQRIDIVTWLACVCAGLTAQQSGPHDEGSEVAPDAPDAVQAA